MSAIEFSEFGTLARRDDTTVVRIHFDNEGTFRSWVEHLGQVVARPAMISEMMRRIVAQTVLKEVTQAFIANLPKAMNMEYEKGKWGISMIGDSPRKRFMSEHKELGGLYARLQEAQMKGDVTEVAKVREAFMNLKERYRSSLMTLKTGKEKSSHYLSSGLFRERAMKVLAILGNPNLLTPVMSDNAISIGVGSIAMLDLIKTPSATQYVLKRGPTKSHYNILWRHLEFGTGVHARHIAYNDEGEGPTSRFKQYARAGETSHRNKRGPTDFATSKEEWAAKAREHGSLSGGERGSVEARSSRVRGGGGWFYGRDMKDSLQLRGSHPMGALYTKEGAFRGVQAFHRALEVQLAQLLRGPTSSRYV